MNPSLLSEISYFNPYMDILVFRNGGHLEYRQSGTMYLLPLNIFYNPDSISKILALVGVTSQFRVTMDYNNEPAIFVHTGPDPVIKFYQWRKVL